MYTETQNNNPKTIKEATVSHVASSKYYIIFLFIAFIFFVLIFLVLLKIFIIKKWIYPLSKYM